MDFNLIVLNHGYTTFFIKSVYLCGIDVTMKFSNPQRLTKPRSRV